MKLTGHFTLEEFACKCKCGIEKHLVQDCTLTALDLEEIRSNFNKKIRVISGIRCKAHNESVGGEDESRHLPEYADGVDIEIAGVDSQFLAGIIFRMMKAGDISKGGIGTYRAHNGVHFDRRGKIVMWRR